MHRKILIAVLLLGSFAAFAQKKKKNAAKAPEAKVWKDTSTVNYKAIGAPLPPIRVVTSAGKNITNRDVAYDGNLLVMLFNPTCEHCENVTAAMEKNIFLFKKTKVLMVAAAPMMEYLSYFENNMKTAQYPTFIVGIDSNFLVDRTFAYQSLPQINIYDKDRRFVKMYAGEVAIDSLKQYIQ